MYYLKLFDKDLLSFEMDNDFGLTIKNIKVLTDEKELLPLVLRDQIDEGTVEIFLKSRFIPKNRTFVNSILESAGLNINDRKAIIDVSKGLSLTDSYWIVQDNSLRFKDYNLFDNNFSKVLSLIAFTGYSSTVKGLTTSPEFTTNGMLPKAWRKRGEEIYLFKGSTESYRFANCGLEPYSEYYASQVAKKMGICHVEYGLSRWKKTLSSTCKLFTSKDISYVQIGDVVTHGGIKAVYEFVRKHGFEDKFSDMILFDSLCMNADRHFGNFGLLRNNHSGKFIDMAPIFDNGESLLTRALDDVFSSKEAFLEYIWKSEVDVSYYGVRYEDLVREFCNKNQIVKLRKLLNFEFTKHSTYNLSSKRLRFLSLMIRERARRFIDILSEKK